MTASGSVTYVIGHRNPDTDSIAAALGYAEFRQQAGETVVAARAGHLNAQTAYILEQLGLAPPVYLADARMRCGEALLTDYIACTETSTLRDALELFRRYGFRYLPVVDADRRPLGFLTLDLITRGLLRLLDNPRVFTSLAMLRRALGGTLLAGGPARGRTFKAGIVLTTGSRADFHRDLRAVKDAAIVITDDRFDLLRGLPPRVTVAAVVCVDGYRPPAATVQALHRRGGAVLLTGCNAAQATLRVKQSLPVSSFYDRNAVTVPRHLPLAECRDRLGDAGGVMVTDDDGRIAGIITTRLLLARPAHRLILVDHNEPAQMVEGAEEAEIIAVIDHHRIAPPAGSRPIMFLNYPVGSTSTIVARLFRDAGCRPSPAIGKLLLAGILSDTVLLKSPTTTEPDRAMVAWLAEQTQFRWEPFALAFFAAGAKLDPAHLAQAVRQDCKEYTAGTVRFAVAQLETVGYAAVEPQYDRLLAAVAAERQRLDLDFLGLMITDISTQTSVLLADGEAPLLAKLPFRALTAHRYDLQNIISRKKQLVPPLLRLFAA